MPIVVPLVCLSSFESQLWVSTVELFNLNCYSPLSVPIVCLSQSDSSNESTKVYQSVSVSKCLLSLSVLLARVLLVGAMVVRSLPVEIFADKSSTIVKILIRISILTRVLLAEILASESPISKDRRY